jgi:hypothetical protein
MTWQIYERHGIAYVPTVAQTDAGFYLGIEPVEVTPVANLEALQTAIWRSIARGHPRIATPTRENFPKPVLLKYARVKSWSAFERDASYWSVVDNGGSFEICRGRKRTDRGWEDDPTQIERLPRGIELTEVARRIATVVQGSRCC